MVHPQKAAGPPQWHAPERIQDNSETRQWNSDREWPHCSISGWILQSGRQKKRHHQTTAWVRKSVGIGDFRGWKRLQSIRELGELPAHTFCSNPHVHTTNSHGTAQTPRERIPALQIFHPRPLSSSLQIHQQLFAGHSISAWKLLPGSLSQLDSLTLTSLSQQKQEMQ